MSKQLLVLGCSERKRETPGLIPAIERYDGPTYRVLRGYLRDHDWPQDVSVAVLSAEYGLVGGLTRIRDYNKRMTPALAASKADETCATLLRWVGDDGRLSVSLGKDYLPALQPVIDDQLKGRTDIFEGPIGMKQSQVKQFLERSGSPRRSKPAELEAGTGKLSYILPDWDDLLDESFDFENDRFSGPTRAERDDKHCTTLMKPERMCDGILVSLAQHLAGKGPLRRFEGTHPSSLAPINLKRQFGLDEGQVLFGDCGAFSYVQEDEPTIGVEQAVSLYGLHSFDYGASVDHIPVPQIAQGGSKLDLSEVERQRRVDLTIQNAEAFLALTRKRGSSFTPVGAIQGLSPESYAQSARHYHEFGYRHLAIGGLVPLSDDAVSAIVRAVMLEVATLTPRPWVHLFGVFRPKLQSLFRELKVDSFDSATYFRKAWLRSDQNYLAPSGKWYAALRVPMTSDPRTLKKLQVTGANVDKLRTQEAAVLAILRQYDAEKAGLPETLDAVLGYDEQLARTSDSRSLRHKYVETLSDRPWKACMCPFCQKLGIQIMIFRGCNRNKRRGAHNTLMLYGSLEGAS